MGVEFIIAQTKTCSETKGSRGEYLTLSHCWNRQTEQCKLTTLNYEDRLNGRSFGELSDVFADAICVTKHFRYTYIWIDSLYIIQDGDDSEDWREEARKMAQYYHLSVLNITALTKDPLCGFLLPHDDPVLKGITQLPYRSPQRTFQGYFYIYKIDKIPE
jgi:hypothetical protein